MPNITLKNRRGDFMLAIKGIYNNGKVTLEEEMPIQNTITEVIVIFPDNKPQETSKKLSLKEKRELFEEFSGSVNRILDIKTEKSEALEEKYESTD